MATVGKLIAILEARSAAFSRGIDGASRRLERFHRQASRISRGVIGFLAGRSIFSAFRSLQNHLDSLGSQEAVEAVTAMNRALDELRNTVLDIGAPLIQFTSTWISRWAEGARVINDFVRSATGTLPTLEEAFNKANRAMAGPEAMNEARRIFEETRTPLEKFEEQMKRLETMRKHDLFRGLGGIDTFNRAVQKLNEELEKAQKKKPLSVEREGQFREVRFGQISSGGPSASPEAKAADEALKAIQEINRHLLSMTSNGKLQVEVSL